MRRASGMMRRRCQAGFVWRLSSVAMATIAALGATAAYAEERDREMAARGVLRAEAEATISSELVARVVQLPFRAGQTFNAGEVLVAFDCSRYDADLRAAQAEARTHEITVETQRHLLRHRATGANDLALAEAKHAQALAMADSLRVRTSQCAIAAPYAGRVVERFVDVFEMPQANGPLIRIVKAGRIEIDLILPSQAAVWLEEGADFEFKVDETNTVHGGRIMHLGAVIDPVSQTLAIRAELVDPSPVIRPGMSGTAHFRASSEKSYAAQK